nr:hypothetical protein [Candidatus Sigynarchaeota archaeon]
MLEITFLLKSYMAVILSYLVIRTPFLMQFSVREHLKEQRAYIAWKKNLDEKPLPSLAMQTLIRDGKV